MLAQLTWTVRIVGISRRQERHIVGLGVRPTLLKSRVPEGEVLQAKDFPHAILLDVLVLVDATLPPLHQAPRVCVLDALMGARRHHAAEATFRASALVVHVDDALDLGVIEQEAVHRAITAGHEGLGEAIDVEPLHALFAIVAATEELDARVRMIGVQLSNLVSSAKGDGIGHWASHLLVQALVEIVAVLVLELANFLLI